jgi:Protein CHAPERONE-LIKE PROTEIN OF POR1-like
MQSNGVRTYMMTMYMYLVALLIAVTIRVEAFVPSQSIHHNVHGDNHLLRNYHYHQSSLFVSTISTIPNPFNQLPWKIQKEREREIRRNKIERSKIYRQIGIAEDATYEEIVDATNRLIDNAGTNLKQKIQIEIMKDQILQHRLNERLNGLLVQERMSSANKEARAMSNYEMDGYVRVIVFSNFDDATG